MRSGLWIAQDLPFVKEKWSEYAHVHKQNIDYCPATFKMVEKWKGLLLRCDPASQSRKHVFDQQYRIPDVRHLVSGWKQCRTGYAPNADEFPGMRMRPVEAT